MKARVLAYAKLNLSLEVCGLRSDGFHDIRSLVQTIDLADRIEEAWSLAAPARLRAERDGSG